jgi:hypothetical protein
MTKVQYFYKSKTSFKLHFEFSNNTIHEAQSSKEETNTNLSTSVNLHKEPMNLHRVPHFYTPLGDSNKNYNPEFEIGALEVKA